VGASGLALSACLYCADLAISIRFPAKDGVNYYPYRPEVGCCGDGVRGAQRLLLFWVAHTSWPLRALQVRVPGAVRLLGRARR